MLKSVFVPNQTNLYAWTNILLLIVLVAIGKIDASTILFGYFLESIIIGVFNAVKMYRCNSTGDNTKNKLFLIGFFLFHYGFFIAVQSIFLFAIFGISDNSLIKEPFNLITNYKTVLALEGMNIMLLVLAVGQVFKYYFDFIVPKKYEQFTTSEIMFKPYARIFIQQFVVIIGGFFIIFSVAPILTAILLILIRSLIDFFFVAIRENSVLLDRIVDKMYDGKTPKEDLKKQLLLFSE